MATLPTSPGWRAVSAKYQRAQARTVSPFTYQAQTQLWSGERWEFEFQLPPMKTAAAGAWLTFLHTLAKNAETFSCDVSRYVPTGVSGTMTLRLTDGQAGWNLSQARMFGITFKAEQAL
jgi:hypothetical protein